MSLVWLFHNRWYFLWGRLNACYGHRTKEKTLDNVQKQDELQPFKASAFYTTFMYCSSAESPTKAQTKSHSGPVAHKIACKLGQ